MAYKTIRNNALKGKRIITGDYNGKDWYCTDVLATEFNIFKDYKINKYNQVMPGRPLIGKILDKDYPVTYSEVFSISPEGNNFRLNSGDNSTLVNSDYWYLFMAIYPDAKMSIAVESTYKPELEPVRVFNNNKLVGVIMPLKD